MAKGLGPASVRGTFVALNKVFRYAQRHDHVAKNPCAGTELPRSDAQEMHCLSPAQVEILAAERDKHARYGLLVRFAAYTGLSRGDLAGLQVRDVNLLRKTVRVERTLQRTGGLALSTRSRAALRGRFRCKPDSRWLLAISHPRSSPPDALENAANQPTSPRHAAPCRSRRPVPGRVSSLPHKVTNGRYGASDHVLVDVSEAEHDPRRALAIR
jgi:integrase